MLVVLTRSLRPSFMFSVSSDVPRNGGVIGQRQVQICDLRNAVSALMLTFEL